MDPYLGEIRIFAGNFAPKGWALCNGQLLPVASNSALFSLLGAVYGGDGKTTFALPNLQGRAPMHAGSGNGLTPRSIGQAPGAATESLNVVQIPAHSHGVNAVKTGTSQEAPANNTIWSNTKGRPGPPAYTATGAAVPMNPLSLTPVGGSQPHNNRQPYTGLNFIICLAGIYPPRS